MAYGHGFIDVIFLSGSIQRSWFIIHIEISLIKGYFGIDFIGMRIFSSFDTKMIIDFDTYKV